MNTYEFYKKAYKEFIDSRQRNYRFFGLRGESLQGVLSAIDEIQLEYRYLLGLPDNLSFGVEIEYEGINIRKVDNFIQKSFDKWISTDDGSLRSGGEIISPILFDSANCWKQLKEICQFLQKNNAVTTRNAGGHIHIGTNILGFDLKAWITFLKLYAVYERILFRFAYGDKVSARHKIRTFARPSGDMLYQALYKSEGCKKLSELLKYIDTEKNSALNFKKMEFCSPEQIKVNSTLEFRFPNATVNEIIWQNNINTFTKMLVSARDQLLDLEYLDYKFRNEYRYGEMNRQIYNEIDLEGALEFVDLVFDNNKDKIYFLKQYLKNFEENYGYDNAVFVKKRMDKNERIFHSL